MLDEFVADLFRNVWICVQATTARGTIAGEQDCQRGMDLAFFLYGIVAY